MLLRKGLRLCMAQKAMMPEQIRVEVVFALPEKQVLLDLALDRGATIADAIAAAGLQETFSGESLDDLETGVWGHPAARNHHVRDGDRIELYRPLLRDPREARRERAQLGLTMNEPENS